MKTGNLDGQKLAELRNYKMQNLAATPTGVVESQFWYDTVDKEPKYYNGTATKSFGKVYTFDTDSFTNTNDTISLNAATSSKLGGVIIGNNISVNSGTISVASASTSTAGVIEIATDSEARTGTATDLAVTPYHLAEAMIASKVDILTNDIHIDSTSTNYLEYEYKSSAGYISAKVDTSVTANSTKLITSGAVNTAINNAIAGGIIYKGVWTVTSSTSDYSGIPFPVKAGWEYDVSGSAQITLEGVTVDWNSGDYIRFKNDVASAAALTNSDFNKIDNTESSDTVKLNATQTLTNKTIDADDNTISNLTTSNFKSGAIVTAIGSTGSDSAIPTEKAVRDALSSTTFSYSEQNSTLTQSGGVCTWTITHNLNTLNVTVAVYEVSTSDKVLFDYAITSVNVVTVKILSASDIAADTYKAVVLG